MQEERDVWPQTAEASVFTRQVSNHNCRGERGGEGEGEEKLLRVLINKGLGVGKG